MQSFVFYAVIVLAMLVLLRIITAPVRLAVKLLINTACGWALLLLFDLFAGLTGFSIAVNLISAAIVGFLGLPGFGFLLILRYLAL